VQLFHCSGRYRLLRKAIINWAAHNPRSAWRVLSTQHVHFFWALPVGVALLLLGVPVLLDQLSPEANIWSEPVIWPLNYLDDLEWGLLYTLGGTAMLLDAYCALPHRGVRVATWCFAWALLGIVAAYSTLAMLASELHPLGSWAAWGAMFIGHSVLLYLGPPLTDQGKWQ
jgi:hypothetical protein